MTQDDNSGLVVWFLAGAAMGATVALLWAPASGSETRQKLMDQTRGGRESLVESGRDMIERGRDLYEKGRQIADDAAEMFERGRRLVEG